MDIVAVVLLDDDDSVDQVLAHIEQWQQQGLLTIEDAMKATEQAGGYIELTHVDTAGHAEKEVPCVRLDRLAGLLLQGPIGDWMHDEASTARASPIAAPKPNSHHAAALFLVGHTQAAGAVRGHVGTTRPSPRVGSIQLVSAE